MQESEQYRQHRVSTLSGQHAAELPIKFFVTSRPVPHIEDEFRQVELPVSKILHDIEEYIVKTDIGLYIKDCFKEIARRKLREDEDGWPSRARGKALDCSNRKKSSE